MSSFKHWCRQISLCSPCAGRLTARFLCLLLTDLDARPWDFQAEECALRACVDRFNSRRYGFDNGERLGDNSEEDEYQPVDNDVLSVLGGKVELSSEFKNNYERWLDREVFSVSIDWDQLCTCVQ